VCLQHRTCHLRMIGLRIFKDFSVVLSKNARKLADQRFQRVSWMILLTKLQQFEQFITDSLRWYLHQCSLYWFYIDCPLNRQWLFFWDISLLLEVFLYEGVYIRKEIFDVAQDQLICVTAYLFLKLLLIHVKFFEICNDWVCRTCRMHLL